MDLFSAIKQRAACFWLLSSLWIYALPFAVSGFTPLPKLAGSVSFSLPLLQSTLAPTSTGPTVGLGDENVLSFRTAHRNKEARAILTEKPPSHGPLSMSVNELAAYMGGQGRARLVWDCYSIGIDPAHFYDKVIKISPYEDFETIYGLLPSSRRAQRLGLPALEQLSHLWQISSQGAANGVENGVAKLSYVSQSRDGTTKLLLELADGLQVETVIIPWDGVRSTLCISSQVGCAQGCRFCATGKMGLKRSLTSDEILAQMFFAVKLQRWYDNLPTITNVVFMGMGEPADNAEAVQRAVEVITTRELFQLSASKVTVSTVAPTPDAFMKFAQAPCVLAWSVHAARDELRKELVPTTQYTINELKQGFVKALLQRPHNFRTSMLEVVLIDQVNHDIDTDGKALVELCKSIVEAVPGCRLMVNLIPYNDISVPTSLVRPSSNLRNYKAPSPATVEQFQRFLWSEGVVTHVRTKRGDDEAAACGQLATAAGSRKRLPENTATEADKENERSPLP